MGPAVRLGQLLGAHPNVAATPKGPAVRAGVDLGLRALATVATVDEYRRADHRQYVNPARCGRLCVSAAGPVDNFPPVPGSRGWMSAKAKLTSWTAGVCTCGGKPLASSPPRLASEYSHVVIEDLDVAAMKRSMGRRAFRRSVADAAMGLVRPQLVYKTARHGATLTVADRWFASARSITAACSPTVRRAGWKTSGIREDQDGQSPSLPITGEDVDRDINAARNLRDWRSCQSTPSQGVAPPVSSSGTALETAAQTVGTTDRLGVRVRPPVTRRPRAMRAEPKRRPTPSQRNPRGAPNDHQRSLRRDGRTIEPGPTAVSK